MLHSKFGSARKSTWKGEHIVVTDKTGNSILRLIGLVLFINLITSCSEPAAPVLRLGTNVWPGYEPLYMARELGYLDNKQVRLVEYSSTSQVLQAYRNELIDAAAMTLDEAILLLETDESPRIIIVTDISNGADVIIGKNEMQGLSDIAGKKVGVEGNALGAYMITRALDSIQQDKQFIHIVQVNADEHAKAFLDNKIDVVVTFDPARSKLLKAGGRILFDSSQIPGEIVDIIVVRDEYLRKHQDVVRYLQDVWFKTLKEISEQPGNSAKLLGKRMKLDVDETLNTYRGLSLPSREESSTLIFSKPQPGLLKTAQLLSDIMQKNGLLSSNVNVEKMFISENEILLNMNKE